MIKVLFFGPVAERVGQRVMEIEHQPEMCLQELRDALALKYPQAFDIVTFVAVNGVQVRDVTQPLMDHSEIAFMAKFSGG